MEQRISDIVEKLTAAERYLFCAVAVTGHEEYLPFYYTNETLWNMLGYTWEKRSPFPVSSLSQLMDKNSWEMIKHVWHDLAGNNQKDVYCRFIHKDGYSISIKTLSRRFAYSQDIAVWVHQFVPFQEDAMDQSGSWRLDYLTGMLNRCAVTHEITNLLKSSPFECGHKIKKHAFIMIDIDFFKQINDKKGHSYGDSILQEWGALIKESLGADDICGRLGGDEFIVFFKDIAGREALSVRLEMLGNKLQIYKEDSIFCSCSIGAAIYPEDGVTFQELYEKADRAMYYVKERGRNGFAIYDSNKMKT